MMASQSLVEIRLICNADYLDPKLKIRLYKIRDKLRQLLRIDRKVFILKKIQPWNSVQVTFDMPKEAADRLGLLAIEDNKRLIELGIISVEIVGQTNVILGNGNSLTMNSKTSSPIISSNTKSDEDNFQWVKTNDNI